MKKAVTTISYIFMVFVLFGLFWWLGRVTAPAVSAFFTDTVTDTITDWRHDTVMRVDTRVVRLPVHDTVRMTDSVVRVDSVVVEVPIYQYRYDTTILSPDGATQLRAVLTGYDVTVDTLAVSTVVEPVAVKEAIPWYRRFRPSVGVGVGANSDGEVTTGVFVGVGYLW